MSHFDIARSTTIARPGRVHALVNDFHEWPAWSPWEDVDPALQRTYSGPDSGVGAHYAWSGNRRAGSGSMEITSSTPDEIDLRLSFLKPWKATNEVTFTLVPAGDGTEVTWRMTGEQKGRRGVREGVQHGQAPRQGLREGLARLKAAET